MNNPRDEQTFKNNKYIGCWTRAIHVGIIQNNMFSGSHEVRSEKEVLTRDIGFLVRNNVSPFPAASVRIPMLSLPHDLHANIELYSGQVTQKIARVINFTLPHEVMDANSKRWRESDERGTQRLIVSMCEGIGARVLKSGSEALFAFMGFQHRPLIRNARNRDYILADIVYGMKIGFGDGGRYDNGDGTTSFDQRKGSWARSTHFYIRTTSR